MVKCKIRQTDFMHKFFKKPSVPLLICAGLLCAAVFLAAGCAAKQGAIAFGAKDRETEETKPAGIPLPILMYHTVCPGRHERYVIPPSVLEEDLIYIKSNGYTAVTIADLIGFKEKGIPLPEKPIMLTFDDGNRTNYLHAFPLLQKHGLKAVFSVVGAYCDEPQKHSSVTYGQIKEMTESGLVEIQNHSYGAHKIGKRNGLRKKRGETAEEYEAFLTADLLKFEQRLEKETGLRTSAVTFPFGAFSAEAIAFLPKLGFKAALICTEGVNYITKDTNLFLLKRYNRPYGKSAERILSRAR